MPEKRLEHYYFGKDLTNLFLLVYHLDSRHINTKELMSAIINFGLFAELAPTCPAK